MIKIKEAIIVEGKYDKIRLSNIVDGLVITTDGFGIFKDKEKQMLIRRLADTRGILVFTDSDGAGFVIRNFLKGTVPKDKLFHAYIPDITGKEKRKTAPSKEGLLGVEGISDDILIKAICSSGAHCDIVDAKNSYNEITKTDLYLNGLSGNSNSRIRRQELQKYLDLPSNMTSNSLTDVLNCLMTKEEFYDLCKKLFDINDGGKQ